MGPGRWCIEQYQKLIKFAKIRPNLATYESGGEGINALKAVFKQFVEMIDADRGLFDLEEIDGFLEVAWGSICSTAMLLVFRRFLQLCRIQ